MHQITIAVRGMSGAGCVREVRDALRRVPGVYVESVRIGHATLSYDAALVDRSAIIAAIEHAGYAQ